MEYGYSILMIVFGVAIIIYAALAAIFKSKKFLYYRGRNAAKITNEKEYMLKFAKILALVGLAPIISGLLALLIPVGAALIILVALVALFIYIGSKTTKING